MQQKFKEGNACWNCRYINKCRPLYRPNYECSYYEPLGRVITQQVISEWLGIGIKQVEYIIFKFGADKIVEMLKVHGYLVRYEYINENIRFYDITLSPQKEKKYLE